MRDYIHNRAIKHAQYFITNDTTIRETAKAMHSSKGTVHTDLIKRLPEIHPALYEKVREKLEKNKATRHMRGGLRTKEMWEQKKREVIEDEQAAEEETTPTAAQ